MWQLECPEEKTVSVNLMTFSRDATYLKVDVFHSMKCYLITQGGGHRHSDEHTFLFLCFENLRKGGSSDRVHKETTSCIGHVPGVTSKLTPSVRRFSAAYQMAQHPIINIAVAIVRRGWYFEGESCLFYYITKILHVIQVGLVLINYADPKNFSPCTALIALLTTRTEITYINTFTIYLGPRLVMRLLFLQ